jgi:hypothetical protein
MNGFKGFDKDMKCRGMQYAVGETATHKGTLSLCNSGLHFVENPIDIFSYYPPSDSRFAEVEADGVANAESDDTERVAKSLHIKAEVSLSAILGAGVKFILDKVDWKNAKESNTGNRSAATNTGDRSAATNTGNRSAATNTGYRSAATNTGYNSAATNTGYNSAATNTGDRSAATNTGYMSAATNTGYNSAATNTGYRSAATNTGYMSAATNTGDRSAATNTGNRSAATNTGKYGTAISLGIEGRASGSKGNFLVLAEWKYVDGEWKRTRLKSVEVDGKKIKADIFYTLKRGRFVPWKE